MPGQHPGAAHVLIALAILGVVMVLIARAGKRGTLRRNGVIGIRLSATLRSDEAWREAHRVAAPMFYLSGLTALGGAALGGLLHVFAWQILALIIGVGASAATVVLIVRAGIVGNHAAARVLR